VALVRDHSNVDAVATKYRVLIIEAKKNLFFCGLSVYN